jgi:2-phospho-L-lactate guanylyltransferase
LVLPADVPFATAADVRAVLGELGSYPIVLTPASCDGGTNALAMRRPDLIKPGFGENSFAEHQKRARAAGIACGVVRTEGIGHDIDGSDDLLNRAGLRKSSLTSALLAELKVVDRLGTAPRSISTTVSAK